MQVFSRHINALHWLQFVTSQDAPLSSGTFNQSSVSKFHPKEGRFLPYLSQNLCQDCFWLSGNISEVFSYLLSCIHVLESWLLKIKIPRIKYQTTTSLSYAIHALLSPARKRQSFFIIQLSFIFYFYFSPVLLEQVQLIIQQTSGFFSAQKKKKKHCNSAEKKRRG